MWRKHLKERIPEKLIVALEDLIRAVKKELGSFELYLIGSYARGDWVEGVSDVDIIVVSKAFEGVNFYERCARIRRLAPPDTPFEILCYTPEELERLREESSFLREASRYWIRLWPPKDLEKRARLR